MPATSPGTNSSKIIRAANSKQSAGPYLRIWGKRLSERPQFAIGLVAAPHVELFRSNPTHAHWLTGHSAARPPEVSGRTELHASQSEIGSIRGHATILASRLLRRQSYRQSRQGADAKPLVPPDLVGLSGKPQVEKAIQDALNPDRCLGTRELESEAKMHTGAE